jgi:hypothetical protein
MSRVNEEKDEGSSPEARQLSAEDAAAEKAFTPQRMPVRGRPKDVSQVRTNRLGPPRLLTDTWWCARRRWCASAQNNQNCSG